MVFEDEAATTMRIARMLSQISIDTRLQMLHRLAPSPKMPDLPRLLCPGLAVGVPLLGVPLPAVLPPNSAL